MTEAVFAALRELNLDPENSCDGAICRIFSTENEALSTAVGDLVESALRPIIKQGMDYFLYVQARVTDQNVDIRAQSPAFKPGESGHALQERLKEIRPDIGEIVPGRRIHFHTSDGLRSVPCSTHIHADDDDDDDDSPNWPSKTGNPSGKGRDNNPPKR